MTSISDVFLDAIRIEPMPRPHPTRRVGTIDGSSEVATLIDALDFFDWSRLPKVADAVLERHGVGLDGTGFRYPEDLDPDEEPFEGVNVYTPLDDVVVSLAAFERLMSRYFHVLIVGAEAMNDEVVQAMWWPSFKKQASALEARIKV